MLVMLVSIVMILFRFCIFIVWCSVVNDGLVILGDLVRWWGVIGVFWCWC